MYTFCLNYRTKGVHLFPSFWGKSCASQYSFFFFFFFRLAHLLVNFVGKRCAPFGEYIKQKVYTFCFNFLPQGLHLLPHKVVVYKLSCFLHQNIKCRGNATNQHFIIGIFSVWIDQFFIEYLHTTSHQIS